MAKITLQKARKPYTCGKCGKAIPCYHYYYRCNVPFKGSFIRCSECTPKQYEFSGSEYVRFIGKIKYEWKHYYKPKDSEDYKTVLRRMIDGVCELEMETEDSYDNLPDGIQSSDLGYTLDERVNELDDLHCKLERLLDREMNEEELIHEIDLAMQSINFDY